MKNSFALKLAVLSIILIFNGCKKETVSPLENAQNLLISGIWKIKSATVDNQTVTVYDGMTITFTKAAYTTTNGGSLWPPSGTWEFLGGNKDLILRDDGLEITIIKLTSTELIMGFLWDDTIYDGGRTESVGGEHRMTFGK